MVESEVSFNECLCQETVWAAESVDRQIDKRFDPECHSVELVSDTVDQNC